MLLCCAMEQSENRIGNKTSPMIIVNISDPQRMHSQPHNIIPTLSRLQSNSVLTPFTSLHMTPLGKKRLFSVWSIESSADSEPRIWGASTVTKITKGKSQYVVTGVVRIFAEVFYIKQHAQKDNCNSKYY